MGKRGFGSGERRQFLRRLRRQRFEVLGLDDLDASPFGVGLQPGFHLERFAAEAPPQVLDCLAVFRHAPLALGCVPLLQELEFAAVGRLGLGERRCLFPGDPVDGLFDGGGDQRVLFRGSGDRGPSVEEAAGMASAVEGPVLEVESE